MKRRAVSHRRALILCEGITEEVYAKALRIGITQFVRQRLTN